jgi:hypothetical protein
MALLALAAVTIVALVALIKSTHPKNRTACGVFFGVYTLAWTSRTVLEALGGL